MNVALPLTAPSDADADRSDQLGYARSMFETIREPLLLLDGEGQVHMANAAFFRALSVTSEETVGRQLSELSGGHWNDRKLMALLSRLQATGEGFEDFELARAFDRVGERVLLLTARLLVLPHNADRMTLLAVVDVTERRRVESALAWHATELERSNRDLEGYAIVASHDLQEPLRKIRAFGDLLLTECAPQLDDTARDYATRMVAASARMQTLVGDLLRLAVVGTGRQQFARVDLGEVIREVLLDLAITIREADGVVQVGEMPSIECDRGQMKQLFQNLISNAMKFRRGAPVVRIATTTAVAPPFKGAARGAPWVSVSVVDNGIGFAARYAEKIFSPFERLHGRGKYAGSGIGLTLCRRICERHFGSITTESTPDVGTAFTITLPSRQPLDWQVRHVAAS